MRVTVNGEPVDLADGATVATLLAELGYGAEGIAVARNRDVVPRGEWSTTRLDEGDRVEILDAHQGG